MSGTSSSNYRRNKAEIDKFRKELKGMFDDIREIDIKVLNKAVNEGVKVAKEKTNVVSNFMRKSWTATPTVKGSNSTEKGFTNSADYAIYVNNGHRIVDKSGNTTGFVKGQFMLEKAVSKVEKTMAQEFNKEVERVNRKHDN